MKRILILVLCGLLLIESQAKEPESKFKIPVGNWNILVVGLDNFYPTYLADPLAVRFEVSSQKILYSDIDFFDDINRGGEYKGKLTIYTGVRLSLLKLSPKHNPDIGIEVDLGVVIPTIMRQGNHDLIGVDGIYYFAVGGKPTKWLSLRFSKHHICTHLGDEFASGSVKSPVDFDPNMTQLPVRDDFIFSTAVRPLYFLGNPRLDILQIYGDLGFFWQGGDFMGTRQNKPNNHAYLNFQGGAEVEYYFNKPIFGGVFSAFNVSAYQPNSFSPNFSVVAGYILPQQRDKRRARIGVNFYNGRSLSNQFYNRKEKYIAFYVAFEV